MKTKLSICLLLFILCLGRGTGFADENPIRLGVQFIMSGEQSGYGAFGKAGVDLAISEINASGGILGRKVQALFADTKLDPQVAAENAKRFIEKEHVDFLMGPTASEVAVVLSKVARRHRKILVVIQSLTDALTGSEFNPYLFSTLSNSIMLSRSGAYLMASKPYKRWMCVGPHYNFGHASWRMFKEQLKKLRPDVQVVGETWPKLLAKDYTRQIKQIQKIRPDAVWCPLWGGDAINFIKQAKSEGLFKSIKFVFPLGASLTVLLPLAKQMPEGIYMTACYFFTAPDSAVNRQFVRSYRSKFRDYPDQMSAEAYAGVYFLKAAIERAGTTDTESIIRAVDREPLAWEGPGGWKIMRAQDHQVVQNVFWGRTAYSKKHGFAVLRHIECIPGELVCRTPAELKEIVQARKSEAHTK